MHRPSHSNRPLTRRPFAQDDGNVTVEFVILFPLMMGLLLLIGSASLHFAISGDVQQLAHELARASLPFAGEENWCQRLRSEWMQPVSANLPMLSEWRVVDLSCDLDQSLHMARITVVYDADGTLAQIFGRMIGLTADGYTRHAFVQV